jgi:hypothetical protein
MGRFILPRKSGIGSPEGDPAHGGRRVVLEHWGDFGPIGHLDGSMGDRPLAFDLYGPLSYGDSFPVAWDEGIEIGLLSLLETTLGPLWVWMGIGERPSNLALAGGAIVIGALLANELKGLAGKAKRGDPESVPPPLISTFRFDIGRLDELG